MGSASVGHSPAWTAAYRAIDRGWPVFPVNGKHPLTPHGYKDATVDPEQLAEWERQFPDANTAVATGEESGLLVVDIDGPQGEARLAELVAEHDSLPTTLTVRTARGRHLYFAFPTGRRITIGAGLGGRPGIDWRGEGGYGVLPGSVHPSGVRYEVLERNPIAPCPDWLAGLLEKPPPPERPALPPAPPPPGEGTPWGLAVLAGEETEVRSAVVGTRESVLVKSAFLVGQAIGGCQLRREPAEATLVSAALAAGLPECEAADKARRAIEAGMASPRAPDPARSPAGLEVAEGDRNEPGKQEAPDEADTHEQLAGGLAALAHDAKRLPPGKILTEARAWLDHAETAYAERVAEFRPATSLFPSGRISGFLPPALPTGLPDLDRKLRGGLRPGNLVLFEGATGLGKTVFANQLMHRMAENGAAVLWFAFEDGAEQLVAYMVARQAGINSVSIALDRYPDEGQREAAEEQFQVLCRGREGEGGILERVSFADARGLDDLRWRAEAFAARFSDRPMVLGVDPLHALPVDAENEVERIGRAMSLTRELTARHGFISLVTAHMNAQGQARGNHSLGHTAHIVLNLEPDETTKDTYLEELTPLVLLTVRKAKNAETGRIRLQFDKPFARFLDLAWGAPR